MDGVHVLCILVVSTAILQIVPFQATCMFVTLNLIKTLKSINLAQPPLHLHLTLPLS